MLPRRDWQVDKSEYSRLAGELHLPYNAKTEELDAYKLRRDAIMSVFIAARMGRDELLRIAQILGHKSRAYSIFGGNFLAELEHLRTGDMQTICKLKTKQLAFRHTMIGLDDRY